MRRVEPGATNVNIRDANDALIVIGDIGNTGVTMTFENMIGPDGMTQVTMHGQNGGAFVESEHDSDPNITHTGFTALSLVPQTGTAWTAGDFQLDELSGGPSGMFLTLLGIDRFGNATSNTFNIDPNGQQQYKFTTLSGEVVTGINISTDYTNGVFLQDIKNVDLNAVKLVPAPATLSLLGVGLAVLGLRRRRQ